MYHHVSLSAFLNPRRFNGEERTCCYVASADIVFCDKRPQAVPRLVVNFESNPLHDQIDKVLARAGIPWVSHRIDGHRIEALLGSVGTDHRCASFDRQFINGGQWRVFAAIREISDDFSDSAGLKIVALPEVAADAVVEPWQYSDWSAIDTSDLQREVEDNWEELNQYWQRTNFDVLVVELDERRARPILAVEFDGIGHRAEEDVRRKDRLKDLICLSAGIPLLRFPSDELKYKRNGTEVLTRFLRCVVGEIAVIFGEDRAALEEFIRLRHENNDAVDERYRNIRDAACYSDAFLGLSHYEESLVRMADEGIVELEWLIGGRCVFELQRNNSGGFRATLSVGRVMYSLGSINLTLTSVPFVRVEHLIAAFAKVYLVQRATEAWKAKQERL